MTMLTKQKRTELQERFCKGCPTPDPEGEKKCPCPRGTKDWYKCGWKATYQETGLWAKEVPT